MSKMLSKMNLISVVQQLPKEDIETIQGYVEMIEEENQELKLQLSGTTHCFDEEEHRELKKQLHEASLTIQEMTEQDIWCPSSCDKLEKLITQQKGFIKYLEEKEKQFDGADPRLSGACSGILQKYKEIIGDDK